MAKVYGTIGYAITSETSPGVWQEQNTEYAFYGDLIENSARHQKSEHLNDDISITNELSVLADPFAFENFQHIRYVSFWGSRWTVTNVRVQYPRLILSLGGNYNA